MPGHNALRPQLAIFGRKHEVPHWWWPHIAPKTVAECVTLSRFLNPAPIATLNGHPLLDDALDNAFGPTHEIAFPRPRRMRLATSWPLMS